MTRHRLHTVYTAQYNYVGPDRVDITRQGNDPNWHEFAPTWDMVMGVKNGTMSEQEYVDLYYPTLNRSTVIGKVSIATWDKLLSMETACFVCFCGEKDFCHKNILVHYFLNAFGNRIKYGGFKRNKI